MINRFPKVLVVLAIIGAWSNGRADEGATSLVVDRLVATVGDDAITLQEVRKRARSANNPVSKMVAGGGDESADLKSALDDLIAEKLVLKEASKLSITASEEDIDRHIQSIREPNGWTEADFANAVTMLGFSNLTAYREHARTELVKSQLLRMKVGSKVRVSDLEVETEFKRQYFGGEKEQEVHLWHIAFLVPEAVEMVRLQEILERARKVQLMAERGEKSFEDLAQEYGEDASAQRGGDVGWFPKGRLQESLEHMAFTLDIGEISPVVQSSVGFHVMRVSEKRLVPVHDAESAKQRIRYELSGSAFNRMLADYIKELRNTTRVEIRGL